MWGMTICSTTHMICSSCVTDEEKEWETVKRWLQYTSPNSVLKNTTTHANDQINRGKDTHTERMPNIGGHESSGTERPPSKTRPKQQFLHHNCHLASQMTLRVVPMFLEMQLNLENYKPTSSYQRPKSFCHPTPQKQNRAIMKEAIEFNHQRALKLTRFKTAAYRVLC